MSGKAKKWGIVAGMAVLAAAVLFAGGIVGGVLTGVIPVQAQDDSFDGPGFGMWRGHGGGMGWWGPDRGWGGPGDCLDTVADVLDMTPEELMSDLQDGRSLAELAEEKGVDSQTIVDAVRSGMDERLQEAVENGRLTQEQADRISEAMAEFTGDRLLGLAAPLRLRMFGAGGETCFGGRGPWGGLDAAAEVLGMDVEELIAELGEGKRLEEIAGDRGVDPQAVEDAMQQQIEQMLQQAEEEGCLSPECATCARQRIGDGEWYGRPGGHYGMPGGRGQHGGWFGCGGLASEQE